MHTHSSRLSGLMAFAVAAAAVAVAAPASADQSEFLHAVQYKYAYLTPQQLITAGYEACALTSRGGRAADAVTMVRDNLQIGVSAAADIVSAATVQLDCR